MLDEVREHSNDSTTTPTGTTDPSGLPVASPTTAATAADTELQDRLVAKLQQSTTQLMHAQTELNSAENQLQHYERQYVDWVATHKPEFTVEGCVDHERGYVLYKIVLVQNKKEKMHAIEHRYSEVAQFRSELKRQLFVADASVVRLPALPPKVWYVLLNRVYHS